MEQRRNLAGDVTLAYLLNNIIPKAYKFISTEVVEGKSPIASTASVFTQAMELQDLISQLGDTVERIQELTLTLEQTKASYADLTDIYADAAQYNDDGTLDEEVYYDGSVLKQFLLQLVATARSITESFSYIDQTQLTQTVNGIQTVLQNYETLMSGKIERGFIENPDYGVVQDAPQYLFGIAISNTLTFTAESLPEMYEVDGQYTSDWSSLTDDQKRRATTYYHLSSGQTMGLYTSTGWQYWVNGEKRGWFDSSDGELHVVQETIEQSLSQGDWRMIADSTGWGIKYVGA